MLLLTFSCTGGRRINRGGSEEPWSSRFQEHLFAFDFGLQSNLLNSSDQRYRRADTWRKQAFKPTTGLLYLIQRNKTQAGQKQSASL